MRALLYHSRVGRRKKRADARHEQEAKPSAGGDARTSLRGLLKGVTLAAEEPAEAKAKKKAEPIRRKPKPEAKPQPAPQAPKGRPSESLRGADLTAFFDAYAGVRPILKKDRPMPASAPKMEPSTAPPERARSDEDARARLAALVAGGVRFEVARDGDEIAEPGSARHRRCCAG